MTPSIVGRTFIHQYPSWLLLTLSELDSSPVQSCFFFVCLWNLVLCLHPPKISDFLLIILSGFSFIIFSKVVRSFMQTRVEYMYESDLVY